MMCLKCKLQQTQLSWKKYFPLCSNNMHRKCQVTAQDSSSGSTCTFAVQDMVEGGAQAFGPEGLLQPRQLFLPDHMVVIQFPRYY